MNSTCLSCVGNTAIPWGTLCVVLFAHGISQGCVLVWCCSHKVVSWCSRCSHTAFIWGYPGLYACSHSSIPHGLVFCSGIPCRYWQAMYCSKRGPLSQVPHVCRFPLGDDPDDPGGPGSVFRTALPPDVLKMLFTQSEGSLQSPNVNLPRVLLFILFSLEGTHRVGAICNTTSLRGSPGPGRDVMQPDQSDWRPARMESPSAYRQKRKTEWKH